MSLTLTRLGAIAASFPIAADGNFESIATVTVGSGGASSIEFTSIPGTYQHLQLRMITRSSAAANFDYAFMQFNSDTGGNYASHRLGGNGSSAFAEAFASSETYLRLTYQSGASATSGIFGATICDILDYADTSKNTTIRVLTGMDRNGAGEVQVQSGLWIDTSAVSSIKIYDPSANQDQYSTAALYGIKA